MNSMRCIICGMNINDKNSGFNENALAVKNDGGIIVCCPFCGGGEKYLSNSEEILINNKYELDENTLKILDHAMKLEVFNSDFYLKASKLVSDSGLSIIFEDLSRIELVHARIHQKLGGFKELPVLQDIDYSKYGGDRELAEVARKREEHAVAYYEKHMPKIKSEGMIRIFTALSDVEKGHIYLVKDSV